MPGVLVLWAADGATVHMHGMLIPDQELRWVHCSRVLDGAGCAAHTRGAGEVEECMNLRRAAGP